MPETYNPQERTFIRRPEPKVCITCGQPLPSEVKPLTNHMNNYVNDINGRVVTMNSNEPFVEVQGVKLRRSDLPKEVPVVAEQVNSGATAKPSTPIPVKNNQSNSNSTK
jgi:hypothetical protein